MTPEGRTQMADPETQKVFAERLLAWTYSMSFPLGVAALICLRVHWGYSWPLPRAFGLLIFSLAIVFLLRDVFVPAFHGHSRILVRQSLYSSAWLLLVGAWLYWRLFGDSGLVLVLAIALPLWPLSHRELLRLKSR